MACVSEAVHVRFAASMSRLRPCLCAAALAGVTAASLAAPAAAPAVTRTVEYGQPGAAQMPAVRGWWNPNGGRLRIPSRHVSPTTQSPQPQTICAEYLLYKFTPSFYEEPWAFQDSRRWCRRVPAGRPATFPIWKYSAPAYSSYTLTVWVSWRVTGGDRLSSAQYDYNLVKDYHCETKNCESAIRYRGVGSIRFES
jgi:hypothetical protein